MKSKGICLKCNSKEVYTNKNFNYYSQDRDLSGGSGTSRLETEIYLCIKCGFFEEYITPKSLSNDRKMRKLKAKWDIVS